MSPAVREPGIRAGGAREEGPSGTGKVQRFCGFLGRIC
jgi:hypothetical protein